MEQMEMQLKVMALELAIKAKNDSDDMGAVLVNAETIVKFIKGEQ
jgi:hypothetical protein